MQNPIGVANDSKKSLSLSKMLRPPCEIWSKFSPVGEGGVEHGGNMRSKSLEKNSEKNSEKSLGKNCQKVAKKIENFKKTVDEKLKCRKKIRKN